jgi:hypothetical protein
MFCNELFKPVKHCKNRHPFLCHYFAYIFLEPRDPRFVNLPAEIFYYGGECGSEETMAQIKSNFQALIQTNLDPYFGIICPPGFTCIARDIVITCGPIESRKKRSRAFGVLKRNLRSTKCNGKFIYNTLCMRNFSWSLLNIEP